MTIPPRRRMPRGLVLLAAAAITSVAGTAAHATDGNLYSQGQGGFSTGALATASQVNAATVQVNAAASASATAGTAWSMNWGCPVPGSEIAAVSWNALRYAAASSADLQLKANGGTVWAEGDAGMPQSPADGRTYGIGLPGGVCDLKLEIVQTEQRRQHARVWWIGGPGVVVRDVAPPTAAINSVPAAWISGGQQTARVAWQAFDNFGSDGIGSQRVSVNGEVRWAGAPGQGQMATDVPLDGLADGVHRVHLDVDGDGTAGAGGDATVRVDRTPPEIGEMNTTFDNASGRATIAWSAADATSGLATATAEVNAAADGSTGGAWVGSGTATRTSAGQRITRVAGTGMADGVHTWRVSARDDAGNTLQEPAQVPIVVDTQTPKIDMVPIPAAWTSTLPLDVTLHDNLESVLGLGDLDVEVNIAADGTSRGDWVLMSQESHAPGREQMQVPLTGLGDGTHQVRLKLRNGGPFGQTLVAQRLGLVRTDLTPPDLARAALTVLPDGRVRMIWSADDVRSGVERVRLQWLDGWTWRTVTERPASDGTGIVTLDPALIPDPEARMRVQVGDVAGNMRAMEVAMPEVARPATPSQPAAPGATTPPGSPKHMADEAREGILTLGLERGSVEMIEGTEYRTTSITYGQAIVVTGRLVAKGGGPLAGFAMVARQSGRDVGSAVTGPDGSFRLRAVPRQSGPVDVGVPDGSSVVPIPSGPRVGVHVRATVTLLASSHEATAKGAPIVFRGKVAPAPGAAKAVVLEWRDPFRRKWRPVVNARTKADGSFTMSWRFQASGLTVPFRVRAPKEMGWPLGAGMSKNVTVRVR
ncbi:MAG: hypothetical protein NT143_07165 [Actinobacteria bacterium]|nr:hypothetical protein [Actinomycetota bacterium]